MSRLPFVLLLLLPDLAHAVVCDVPDDYPSLQAAVNDNNCSEITFGPGEFAGPVTITRSLTLSGTGSVEGSQISAHVKGVVTLSGAGTIVNAQNFLISQNCAGSWLDSVGGASLTANRLVVHRSEAGQCGGELIFTDGFETSP